jgi:hypothetical protein
MSCVTAQTAVDVDALVKTASFSSLSSNLILLTSLTLLTSLPDSRRLISAMQAVLPSINLGLCSFSSLAWPISLMLVTVSRGMVTGMVTGGVVGADRGPGHPVAVAANLAVDFDHNYDVKKCFDQVSCPGF